MAWNRQTAKQYLEITDNASDALIDQVMDMTLWSIESALARKLLLERDQIEFHDVNRYRLILPRYPVKFLHRVNNGPVPDDWHLNPDNGLVTFKVFGTNWEKLLKVDYEGGFEVLPPDLERAMWGAFMVAWQGTDPNTGAPSGGSTTVSSAGDITSVTIHDFGTVKFDSSNASVGAGSESASTGGNWGWLEPWSATLQWYRNIQGTGLGIA